MEWQPPHGSQNISKRDQASVVPKDKIEYARAEAMKKLLEQQQQKNK